MKTENGEVYRIYQNETDDFRSAEFVGEFFAKNEEEAIDNAIEALNISDDYFFYAIQN